MSYVPKLFNPRAFDTSTISFEERESGNERQPYVLDVDILIALDVAMATRRPLLVFGDPGTGKSTLARFMAQTLDWRYLTTVITSRTRLEQLTGDMDALKRLHHAQAAREGEAPLPDWTYRVPGILWWAYNPESAQRQGVDLEEYQQFLEKKDTRYQPPQNSGSEAGETNVVLLLDEIDKADPDVPNDLLEPMDQRRFHLFGEEIKAPDHLEMLTIITTNGERELPPAFLRRCVTLRLKDITEDHLVNVARHHHGDADQGLYKAVAAKVMELRDQARERDVRPPSTGEFLDSVRACKKLGLTPKSEVWKKLAESTLIKHQISGSP
ncbi:MAG: MoxR family ATPase [Candidatus Thiodiazotropha sp.]|nr:MoxR family ATPase [Candidatus Thiodiazotropha sp. (ex Codakia orbicularis)]